ncbi:A24 family peptidase [Streptomyces hesseae]|uniref:A24 family peptidase n=1 Tax=Streptomyces hesseae TaxID=3075519 RepID=A0ABU2STV7_9ACTN|nr:A24 family peptidase [Streptomyces sp. DSM 40473]MDT0452443.1 A24 family peptidase [Streptomyces sp. DSM 40473]
MNAVLIAVAAVYGALAGVLTRRARFRLAVEPGEVWRSTGPCGHAVGGWVGPARCGVCGGRYGPGAPAPPWWPAVMTAVVCGGLAAAVGIRPELAVWLLAAPMGVVLAGVDWQVRRLPDVLTLPLAAGAVLLLGVASLIPGAAGSWRHALLGGLALGGGYLVLFLLHPSGMGFGDVKLAAGLGCALGWYGWWGLLLGAFAGLLLASCYGNALRLTRRVARGASIPLGPFLIAGAWVGVLAGALRADG